MSSLVATQTPASSSQSGVIMSALVVRSPGVVYDKEIVGRVRHFA
jgi:hypothetical protein